MIDGAGARGPAVPWSRTPCRACWAVCKHSLSLVVHPPPTPQSTFYASPFTVRLLAQETGLPHLPRASTNFY